MGTVPSYGYALGATIKFEDQHGHLLSFSLSRELFRIKTQTRDGRIPDHPALRNPAFDHYYNIS